MKNTKSSRLRRTKRIYKWTTPTDCWWSNERSWIPSCSRKANVAINCGKCYVRQTANANVNANHNANALEHTSTFLLPFISTSTTTLYYTIADIYFTPLHIYIHVILNSHSLYERIGCSQLLENLNLQILLNFDTWKLHLYGIVVIGKRRGELGIGCWVLCSKTPQYTISYHFISTFCQFTS